VEKIMPLSRREFIKRSLLMGGGLLAAYPVMIERFTVQVNLYRIALPRLPEAFENFRIVHLTDFHCGYKASQAFFAGVIDKVGQIRKDAVVCTGDYIEGGKLQKSKKQIDTIYPLLNRLHAPCGVYSVFGNHDHRPGFDRAEAWLSRIGQNMRHKVRAIEKKGQRIWIGGAGDLIHDSPEIDALFRHIPEDECKILLEHNPDTADIEFKTRIDLMICGHTHGGQVRIPFIGAPVLPVRNKKYDCGIIRTDRLQLFISRGIGSTILPLRLNCFPEIAVLELKKELV
jgi:predicted MPP superfamily phosphohydrolase